MWASTTWSGPTLIATATLERPTDFAPLSYLVENGLPQNVLGGLGSGLTWAGGITFREGSPSDGDCSN